jgi:hypothetical protein
VEKLAAIANEETPAPLQAMEEVPITEAENPINIEMDNMIRAFEAFTFQLSNANQPRNGSSQTASVYAMQLDHPPPHTPMNSPSRNSPTGLAYNSP